MAIWPLKVGEGTKSSMVVLVLSAITFRTAGTGGLLGAKVTSPL
jgi:hypothetical protein